MQAAFIANQVLPAILSILGIIIGVRQTEFKESMTRLYYAGASIGIIFIGWAVQAVISGYISSNASSSSLDELMSMIWLATIISSAVGFGTAFFLGRFTVLRTRDMGKSKNTAYWVILAPAIFYFMFARKRPTT